MRLNQLLKKTVILVVLACSALVSKAADLKVEALLVWGCNDTNTTFKVADPKLTEGLTRIFKWKNYYEITNKVTSVAQDATQTVEMSSKCKLTIKNLGGDKVEVSCFGEGKLVSQGKYPISDSNWTSALAGNAVDNNAWFVFLRAKKD